MFILYVFLCHHNNLVCRSCLTHARESMMQFCLKFWSGYFLLPGLTFYCLVSFSICACWMRPCTQLMNAFRNNFWHESTCWPSLSFSSTIRQQLINTEDIRRIRKKAPCTRSEIWMIEKGSLEDDIFHEPIFSCKFLVMSLFFCTPWHI